ncbi:superoxide dismutase [Blastocladiella britannica]|nr:superoxide dismutase [Blastocladiella britannica]
MMSSAAVPQKNDSDPTITTEFAVDMTCGSCEKSVRAALSHVPGVHAVDVDIPAKRVVVRSDLTVTATGLFTALRTTQLDVVIRGQGPPGATHAAVAVLEASNRGHDPVRPLGVVRLTQLSATRPGVLVDASATGLAPGAYTLAITETGDLSAGVLGLGDEIVVVATDVHVPSPAGAPASAGGAGGLEAVAQVATGNVWDWVGRGLVVRRQHDEGGDVPSGGDAVWIAGGVIARSAGAFENSKVVCACSGRTLWEEKLGWIPSDERRIEDISRV